MTTLSWVERSRRRGGITQREFIATMTRRGFVLLEESLHDGPLRFTHKRTGNKVHYVGEIETFSRALDRLTRDLPGAGAGMPN